MPNTWRKIANSIPMRIFVGLTFFISGLFINIIQAILFMTLAYFNVELYRKINYYLTYTIWAQIVAMSDWWAGAQVNYYFADERSRKFMGTRHSMFVMNHNYEIDWLVSWLITDRYHMLGGAKSFAKKPLRWIPIMGWSWVFNEFAFLERNWNKDSHKIATALNKFLDYKNPISFLFFAEGTRFTQSKHEASVKFANERGLPVLKYHLVPRTKGFNFCVKTFKEKYPDMLICQIELRFPKDSDPPTFMTLVKGKTLKPDIYIKFVTLHEIPSETEEQMSNYLFKMYKEKDDLVEYYDQHGKFPGIKETIPPRKTCLINWICWLLVGAMVIPYYLINIMLYGGWTTIGIILFIGIFAFYSLSKMVTSTKIQKSGSTYGTSDSKKSN